MKMSPMERSTFNTKYNYRLVARSDNIDLKHCDNCYHFLSNAHEEYLVYNSGLKACHLMLQSGNSFNDSKVEMRGLCEFFQRKNQKGEKRDV